MSFDQKKYDELFNSAKILATIHNLLNQGQFIGRDAVNLKECIGFIETLHKQVYAEVEPMIDEKAALEEAATVSENETPNV